MLNEIDKQLLLKTAELHQVPQGAYNIRKNGESVGRQSSKNIIIQTNKSNTGIDIKILPNTKNESVHIPVILSNEGLKDVVCNDFYIGQNAEVTIVAGCGIHASGNSETEHDGIHSFYIEKGAKVKYVERHYGSGVGKGKIINPVTKIFMDKDSSFVMETYQIGGVDSSVRETYAIIKDGANLNITEKILTENKEQATTKFVCDLEGKDSSCHIVSRAVAKGKSKQKFESTINGKNKCFGHTECDCIIVDDAVVFASPQVNAISPDASLVHEAAIGKIAGEQITKLMTLGLTEEEAQNQVLKGFLK